MGLKIDSVPELRHINKNYFLEQYERVLRWHDRCLDGCKNEKNLKYLIDDYYALFINIYHLKDWVKKWLEKNQKTDLRKELENRVKSEEWHGYVRDLCNCSKHFKYDFSKNHAPSKVEEFTIFCPLNTLDQRECFINVGEKKINLDVLSKQALDFWGKFLQDHGLLDLGPEYEQSIRFSKIYEGKKK